MRFVGLFLKPFSLTQCYLGLLFSVCTLALVTGCEQAGSPRDTGGLVEEKVNENENEVTLAEAEEFAKKYLSAVKKQRTTKLVKLVDWDTLVDRIFSGQSTNTVFYKKYTKGANRVLGRFSKSIDTETEGGGNYALLKIVRRGKDRHVIFRLVTGTSSAAGGGRIDYHNLRLVKHHRKVLADDIYVARTGSWLSESHRTNLRFVQLQGDEAVGGFTSQQREEFEEFKLIAEMTRAIRSGNQAEASKFYQQLPEATQKSKNVLVARLLTIERDEFFKAADAMLAEYPSSPAVGLSLIDFGMRQKDLPTLKRASEMLKNWTGGDTYIDLNIAAVVLTEGDADAAAEMTKEIDLRGFDFVNPVLLQLKIALASKDNVALLECFRILRDDHDEDINKLLKSPTFTDFVDSLEYLDLKND